MFFIPHYKDHLAAKIKQTSKERNSMRHSNSFKTCILIGLSSLYWQSAFVNSAPRDNIISITDIKKHVVFLSSTALAGRLTGNQGEKFATHYAANLFQRLHLQPGGDNGSFFQEFTFTSSVSLGKNNSFTITSSNMTHHLLINQDWRPLSFSENQTFQCNQLVFAGYGIDAPALGKLSAYNSYRGLNVKNKWVLVFRYLPEKIDDEKRRQLSPYASLRYKIFIAKQNGAKGIIFVSGPNAKVKDELIPLAFTPSLTHSGIVAISIKDAIANKLIKNNYSLQKLQDQLDSGDQKSKFELTQFNFFGSIDIKQQKKRGRNVLAKLNLSNATAPLIIIGAHIDHLGRGELGNSREHSINLIHPGADDNASGVASVLAIAAQLTYLKNQGRLHGNNNILFALWSGEELGLLGSTHFVKHFLHQTQQTSLRPALNAYINLDMVGRLSKSLVLQGVGSSTAWAALINQAKQKHALSIVMQKDPYLPTDSTAFYLQGVPTLNFFTGSHDEYHTSRDKVELINFRGIQNITQFLFDLITQLAAEKHNIHYQEAQKTTTDNKREFRIYLGTIPDYASADLIGVKLAGVTKNSPAERAGLKQNDVIVELAKKKIQNIYDYTFALNALHVGEPAAMVVQRGLKQLTLQIVAQSRD